MCIETFETVMEAATIVLGDATWDGDFRKAYEMCSTLATDAIDDGIGFTAEMLADVVLDHVAATGT